MLFRHSQPVSLIPKYFDLLQLLIAQRRDAVSKAAIFAQVWSDVIVTDGALAQAVRTLRRTLGDDVREPRFIRTVSRHGYQFVWIDVIEEPDDGSLPATPAAAAAASAADAPVPGPGIEPLVDQLMAATARGDEGARDVAETLHALGTAEAVAQLTARPDHAPAIALMRDARWSVADAGHVPILGDTEAPRAILALVRLRLADIGRVIAIRWSGAALAGMVGGIGAGLCGGLALHFAPESTAPLQSAVALAAIGGLAGGVGAGGIASGLIAAEVLSRSRRGLALIVCGAIGGAVTAAATSVVLRALLSGLFGITVNHAAGGLDGLLLGAAAGLGYGLATSQPPGGGVAAPHGGRRVAVALLVGLCCAAAGVTLSLLGRALVGGLVHEIARSSQHADLVLAPLGRLIGEPDFGPLTRLILSAFEGLIFGFSLAFGLTSRVRGAPRA